MPKQYWDNSEMALFMVLDGNDWPTYTPTVSIRKISWGSGNTVCQHCGEMRGVKDGRCVNCGSSLAVPSGLSGAAVVEMGGWMPDAQDLFNIKEGSRLEVCRIWSGDHAHYRRGEVVLKMTHCKVIQRVLPDFAVIDSRRWGIVEVLVRMECNAELLLPGEGK